MDDIEVREDGGTPGFLQSIKAALAIELKSRMGVEKIMAREEELLNIALPGIRKIKGIEVLANNVDDRLGVISFYHPDIHFNLFVKLLNDRYGIQTRGGCACAGTYGHFLLEVTYDKSREITEQINHGDLTEKPGWIRWSLHPTMTDEEVRITLRAIEEISLHHQQWMKDYLYNSKKNEFFHHSQADQAMEDQIMSDWFSL